MCVGIVTAATLGCGDDNTVVGTCQPGTKRDCTTTGGEAGEEICTGGVWGVCSGKPCQPGTTKPCTQSGGLPGQQTCTNGQWSACGALPGQCQNDTFKKCTTPDNKEGSQRCVAEQWGPCNPIDKPACTDGAKQACSTACGTGTEVCAKGTWQNCTAPKVENEACDGVDNDCDGKTDEDCACVHGKCEACYTGTSGTKGVGICKAGQKCCDKGSFGACTNEVTPVIEDCTDNLDNDCNGTVNDGCTCTVGQKAPCGSDVGECVKGTKICQTSGGQAVWGSCVGATQPKQESDFGCDGLDNNCDGVIDNGLAGDASEKNDSCALARNYTISDADAAAKVLTLTIYPTGDVDYFKVTAKEEAIILLPKPCWPPLGPPQCNTIEVELIPPSVSGLQFQYVLMAGGTCAKPSQSFTSQGKQSFTWDGQCGFDDSKDFWIKVEPVMGSAPAFSCKAYKLKLRYTKINDACSTSP